MSRMVGAGTAHLRLALAVVIGSVCALLMPALLATQVTTSSPAVLMLALAAAVALTVVLNSRRVTSVPRAPAPHPRTSEAVPSFLAGRVTDPLHHPLRPRAPGLV